MDDPRSPLRGALFENLDLVPLRADPAELFSLITEYRKRVLPERDDADAVRRWEQVEGALRSAGVAGGVLPRSTWHREPAGRLHATNPAVQCIPGFVRPAFQPAPGNVYIDADFVTAHPAIASVRSGDQALARDIEAQGYYEGLAEGLLAQAKRYPWSEGVEVKDLRSTVKRVVCAFVNGGGAGTSARYLGRAFKAATSSRTMAGASLPRLPGIRDLGKWFYLDWWARYPVLSQWGTEVARSWIPGINVVKTLTGQEAQVPAWDRMGWRTVLSSNYSGVEAESMDRLIGALPSGRLVLPLFDGILAEVPAVQAEEWLNFTRSLMQWAMAESGVPKIGVKVVTQVAWSVPL